MKYRRIDNISVDATQWFQHGDHPAVKQGYKIGFNQLVERLEGNIPCFMVPVIRTGLGLKEVSSGDWIVTREGVNYVIPNMEFLTNYEEVAR